MTSSSNEVEVTIDLLPASSLEAINLEAIESGSTEIRLTWDSIADGAKYEVKRDGSVIETITDASTVSFTDTGLTNGQTYSYQIAVFDSGNSEIARSNTVIIIPVETSCFLSRLDGSKICPLDVDSSSLCDDLDTNTGRAYCGHFGAEKAYKYRYFSKAQAGDKSNFSLEELVVLPDGEAVEGYEFIKGSGSVDTSIVSQNNFTVVDADSDSKLYYEAGYPPETRESKYGAYFDRTGAIDFQYFIVKLSDDKFFELRVGAQVEYGSDGGDGTNCDPHFGGSLSNLTEADFGSDTITVNSTGENKLRLQVRLNSSTLQYKLQVRNNDNDGWTDFLDWSNLGIPNVASGTFSVDKQIQGSCQEIWSPKWGRKAEIQNYFKQLTVTTKVGTDANWNVEFRLYDDGLGLRYVVPPLSSDYSFVNDSSEGTQFKLVTQNDEAQGYHIKLSGSKYELRYGQKNLVQLTRAMAYLLLIVLKQRQEEKLIMVPFMKQLRLLQISLHFT